MKRKKVTKKVEPRKKDTEDKASTQDNTKVFDVARPGRGMPSASSRPVIVSHKPSVQDPMVSATSNPAEDTADEEVVTEESSEQALRRPKKNRIEPLNSTIEANDETEATPESDVTEDKSEEDSANEENAERDEVADAAADVATKKQVKEEAEKKAAAQEKHQAEVNALIASKQFFVPINAVKKRRTKQYVFLFLFILTLAALGFLAALDAELIDIGITPPTNYL